MTDYLLRLSETDLLRYQAAKKSPLQCAFVKMIGCAIGLCGIGIALAGRPGLAAIALCTYWGILFATFAIGLGAPGGLLVVLPVGAAWVLLAIGSAASAASEHNRTVARHLFEAAHGLPSSSVQVDQGAWIVIGLLALLAIAMILPQMMP